MERVRVIKKINSINDNFVFAISPISYAYDLKSVIDSEDAISFVLCDTVNNIYDRLVFSDEFDNIYTDNDYKNKYKNHYLREIAEDIEWYGKVFKSINVEFWVNIAGMSIDEIANTLKEIVEKN